MKSTILKLSLCVCVLLNLNCDSNSDELIVPTSVIMEINTLDDGGVELIGDFQNFSQNDDIGFIISSNQGSFEYIVSNPNVGENSIEITANLYLNKRYTCYAFIKQSDDYFMSLQKYFFATSGSAIPSIESISPNIGYIGDLIEINFSEEIEAIDTDGFNIKLDNTEVDIVEIINNQKLVCRVPNFINPFEPLSWASLSMTYLDKVVPSDYEFNIKPPTINSISPEFIDWGGEVTINGDFYKEGYPPTYVGVFVNGAAAVDITSQTHNEIKFEVSIHMFENNPEIAVTSFSGLTVTETNTFSYYPPEILEVQQGGIGDVIEITGNYFWPASYVNTVYFDDYEANITYGDATTLIVEIPDGEYINNTAILRVSTTDQLVSEPVTYVMN